MHTDTVTDCARRRVRQARRALDWYDNSPRLAASALFVLNRLAKRGDWRQAAIYAVKNALVRHFYTAGYCTRAITHKQVFTCWDCDGEGVDEYGDWCRRCGGTGVYREHVLYRFEFDIGGQRFCWHQPARLVSFPVTVAADEPAAYEDREPGAVTDRDAARVDLYLALVVEYLRRADGPTVHGLAAD